MTDKLRDEVALGEQARFLTENDAYKRAWAEIFKALAEQRIKLGVTEKDEALGLILFERAALKFKKALEDFIATGKFASDQLKLENERQSRLNKLMPPWMRKTS